jgi:small-conductance mechanosensitive channel
VSKWSQWLLKLTPILLAAGFVVISGSTTWISVQVHTQIVGQLKALEAMILPIAINLVASFVIVYMAWLLYGSAKNVWAKFLTKVGCAPRGRSFWVMCFQILFWVIPISLAFAVIAPTGLIRGVALSGGVFAAGVGVLALGAKDAFANWFYSICLHTLPKCKEGDFVKVCGIDPAEGTITKISFLYTEIRRKKGDQTVIITNADLWTKTVTIGEPPPKEEKDEKQFVVYCCHGTDCQHQLKASAVQGAKVDAGAPTAAFVTEPAQAVAPAFS